MSIKNAKNFNNTTNQELSHAFYPNPFPFLHLLRLCYHPTLHRNQFRRSRLCHLTYPKPLLHPSQPIRRSLNLSSKDQATNHIVVVKLDTIENKEFDGINDNYISINLNGLTFVVAAQASYAKSSSLFQNLSLISGQTMQVWAEYNAKKMEFNVTLAPLNTLKPVLPLLSDTINFSSVLLSKMYVGFSSSTGAAAGSNYILGWSLLENTNVTII
ncbi:hypothetical protein KFK09_022270 [Dendrobium nobile]|uniref:Legume lectin domain-containing protein n=1 Tax=Dendrobium nobile TaxID=94219 RepID=A0A8T3AIE7_DENNO|nr:hypothetical protein KFK09_022270 [Dendrobium nobile]